MNDETQHSLLDPFDARHEAFMATVTAYYSGMAKMAEQVAESMMRLSATFRPLTRREERQEDTFWARHHRSPALIHKGGKP